MLLVGEDVAVRVAHRNAPAVSALMRMTNAEAAYAITFDSRRTGDDFR